MRAQLENPEACPLCGARYGSCDCFKCNTCGTLRVFVLDTPLCPTCESDQLDYLQQFTVSDVNLYQKMKEAKET